MSLETFKNHSRADRSLHATRSRVDREFGGTQRMSVGQRFGAAIAGVVACALVTGIGGAARATDGIVDEVKVGVLAPDVNIGGHPQQNGVDINGEVLFGSPDFLERIFA